jgi:hypothetical protein
MTGAKRWLRCIPVPFGGALSAGIESEIAIQPAWILRMKLLNA